MSLEFKKWVIAILGLLFLGSLILVQYMEVTRKRAEAGEAAAHVVVPASSRQCVDCHQQNTPGIVDHWKGSTHAHKGIGCYECHQAETGDADAFTHYGYLIATITTPQDCARCHKDVAEEFGRSHHAKGGNILASLDNHLAENIEGSRIPFNPHAPTPGRPDFQINDPINGMASANIGCQQCHGSKVALQSTDGKPITVDDLKPGPDGKPTNADAVARIKKNPDGRPLFLSTSWPNTGIGRLNLDGSRGACSACHSRHDFSPRRARQPENCGKCHLGPDHPQKEIYEESKHGVAYRDLMHSMNLNASSWVLGKDYSQAPTCATCHMSANTRNGEKITHDPGERISWTNRPMISLVMDTDKDHKVITETDPQKRAELLAGGDSWEKKRDRMKLVCGHCHTPDYVNAFYKQYDDLVVLYNEKFARPGASIIKVLRDQKLITPQEFDEDVEWTWYLLWHHEGRRARHGASMMAPDYAHWHGMFEVADRFYTKLVPQVREVIDHAAATGKKEQADAARSALEKVLARPEHAWYEKETGKPGGNKTSAAPGAAHGAAHGAGPAELAPAPKPAPPPANNK